MQTLDKLLEGIGLRSYGQKNPLVEYKRESFHAFETMMKQIKWDIIQRLFKLRPENFDAAQVHEIEKERQKELSAAQETHSKDESVKPTTQRRAEKKVGRNDPCPCGSGKKHKQCCL